MKHQLPTMTIVETILGLSFLFAQLLVIPIAISLFVLLFQLPISHTELNALCFCTNFACAAVIFRHYWLSSIKALAHKWLLVLGNALKYFIVYYGATLIINYLIYQIDPGFSNTNDENIASMYADSQLLIGICDVLLVPPVEEILYRGIVFGKLYQKSPLLGYTVSILLFGAIHVLSYVGSVSPLQLILCFLQYLPAAYCLARAYAVSGSIFAPILMHSTINLIAALLM